MRRRSAVVLLAAIIISALLFVLGAHTSYQAQDRERIMEGHSDVHLAGTDELGRDRAVRVSLALLIGLSGAGAAAVLTTALAAAVGMAAAFSNRIVAALLMFVSDAFLALPWIFLLMMVRASLPLTASPARSAVLTFLVLAVFGWPACARALYRGAVELRRSGWVLQAHAAGLRNLQIVRYALPHLRPLLLPQFLISVPAFLVAEANLGSLGLGVSEPLPSWGTMLLELDNSAILAQGYWVYLPIAVLVCVLLLLEAMTGEA